MPRVLAFSDGPEYWKALLADPEKHWRMGYSARTLAHSWEDADGLPSEVADAFDRVPQPLLTGLTPILAVPEFKVALPGGARPSQNDIFVLARVASGSVCIMVEGKVSESFGPTLDDWYSEPSSGKTQRLRFLLRTLGLAHHPGGTTRYQLLHRAASALITAEQYRSVAGVMIVHSFSQEYAGWDDYAAFTHLFGVDAERGVVQQLPGSSTIPLFAGWVVGDKAYLER